MPQKSSLMAQLSKKPTADGGYDKIASKSKPSSKKFALSHEKENSSNNAATAANRTKSTFYNKLVRRGMQDSSSDDSDQETKKKRSHKMSVARAASAAATTSAAAPSTAAANATSSFSSVPARSTVSGSANSRMTVAVDLTSSPLCPISPSRNKSIQGSVHQTKSVAAAPTSPFGWGF